MATAASIAMDWTTCPICLEVCENPKSLPCLHGFCLECLEQHFEDNCPGDDVRCPLCREEFPIPSNGLADLRHHFFIQHLVDVMTASSIPTDETPCEVCLEMEGSGEDSDECPSATMYCIDCSQKLCEQCSRPHMKMKGGPHQVRTLTADLEQELIQLRPSYCDKHKDKPVELYCHDCNENICVLCFAVKHTQHKTVEIPEAAKAFEQQILSYEQQLWAQVYNIRRTQSEKDKKRSEFLHEADRVKNEVKAARSQLIEIIDNQVALQLSEVDAITLEDQEKADTVEERYQLALVALKNFHAYSRELLEKGSPSDVTRAGSELQKRAAELLNSDVTSALYQPSHVTFRPVDVCQSKHLTLVGKVTFTAANQSGTLVQVISHNSLTVHFMSIFSSLLCSWSRASFNYGVSMS